MGSVRLDPEIQEKVRQAAASKGLTQSEIYRQALLAYFEREMPYLLLTRVGWVAQEALWRMILRGDLILEHPSPSELVRMSELMSKYNDLPMDFADASLVALAERLSLDRIFTVDRRDFSTYRLNGKKAFTVIGPVQNAARQHGY